MYGIIRDDVDGRACCSTVAWGVRRTLCKPPPTVAALHQPANLQPCAYLSVCCRFKACVLERSSRWLAQSRVPAPHPNGATPELRFQSGLCFFRRRDLLSGETYDALFHSPLNRAAHTAAVVWGDRQGPVSVLPSLREVDLYSFQASALLFLLLFVCLYCFGRPIRPCQHPAVF